MSEAFYGSIFIFPRTARGDNKGTALSFVSVKEMKLLEEVEKELAGSAEGGDTVFKPYQFRMEEIEGFKYRAKVNSFSLSVSVCLSVCLSLSLSLSLFTLSCSKNACKNR